MKLDDLIKRADELLQIGNRTLATRQKSKYGGDYVERGKFAEFRAAVLSFVKRAFGTDSPHYTEFDKKVAASDAGMVEIGLGVLKACRDELAGGWVFTTKGVVSAELFSDFLTM